MLYRTTIEGGELRSIDWLLADKWFNEHVSPINKMLSAGVEVYGNYTDTCGAREHDFASYIAPRNTHKALLIGITEIEKMKRS